MHDKPGVTIISLSGDKTTDTATIQPLLQAGNTFLFLYTAGGATNAVFVRGYGQ
jgi:hypothetical protein